MAEHSRMGEMQVKKKFIVTNICMQTVKNTTRAATSTPSSPVEQSKTPNMKINCLCSPTTHVGSFRCRYHRNAGLSRSAMSVGSKLSEFDGKSTGICDPCHAQ